MKQVSTLILFISFTIAISAQNIPYPNHTQYKSHIKPNKTQSELDNATTRIYDSWKKYHLKKGCKESEYKVDYNKGETVSEAHGYGMMITAFMAGYDPMSKEYFDGMFNYFKNHPSNVNANLMAWKQNKNCVDVDGASSASDGDIDIAFALLLADKQWGSLGEINYLAEAKRMIAAIRTHDINRKNHNVTYGDWVNSSSSKYYNATRSSDFIIDHFRSFSKIDASSKWNSVINKCYSIIDAIQINYSKSTGLVPDFIINTNTKPKPASSNHLEGDNDGNYYYNACRFPWRIGTDYLISGDDRAKKALDMLNNWIITKTGNNPKNIKDGYTLDGTEIASWSDAAFVAPLAVSAMLTKDQKWLDDIYNYVSKMNVTKSNYYESSIQLLSMIVISGNYWTPENFGLSNSNNKLNKIKLYPNPCSTGRVQIEFSSKLTRISNVLKFPTS
ncbi:MAG: hypothetical protein KAH10_06160 [Flavobacteriales bacterium]|nr:hypothetical protein [Flavobacteriales bacterium]